MTDDHVEPDADNEGVDNEDNNDESDNKEGDNEDEDLAELSLDDLGAAYARAAAEHDPESFQVEVVET